MRRRLVPGATVWRPDGRHPVAELEERLGGRHRPALVADDDRRDRAGVIGGQPVGVGPEPRHQILAFR
jgi:hypothetical protein